MKTLEDIKSILFAHRKELKEKYNVKEIGIFGSYAKNCQNAKSDLDMLVDYYEVPDLLTFIELESYLEDIIGVKVDFVRKPALRPEIRDTVLKEVVAAI